MNEENKRRHVRIHTLNLSHLYASEGKDGAVQGMGRTLNLSESGMLLETSFDVPMAEPLVLTLGLEDELLELTGHAVYSKPTGGGKYETGIEFRDIDVKDFPKLKWFIHVLTDKGTEHD